MTTYLLLRLVATTIQIWIRGNGGVPPNGSGRGRHSRRRGTVGQGKGPHILWESGGGNARIRGRHRETVGSAGAAPKEPLGTIICGLKSRVDTWEEEKLF